MKNNTSTRRDFIATGAMALGGLAILGLPAFSETKSKNDTISLGLIGTGSRGQGLATLFKDMPGIKLVACCDIIPENLQKGMKMASKGAKSYTDYRKLLEDKSIDAVVIATPLYLHYPMAVASLEAGKHIYLEKSMAYDIPQSIDLVKRVRNTDLVVQVGFQYRYDAMYHRIKEIISQNWLGKVTHFECQYNRNSNWRNPVSDPKMERIVNWRMYREYCGGPLSELCAHEIDAMHFMLGGTRPLKVTGMGGINYWKDGRDTYDNIRTVYEYPNGIKSSVTSVLSNAYNGYGIRILGDKATVEIQRDKAFIYAESVNNIKGTVDGVTGATVASKTQGEAVEIKIEQQSPRIEATFYSLQDFADCIRTKRKPLSNVETAYDTSVAIHMGNMAADTEKLQVWEPTYSI